MNSIHYYSLALVSLLLALMVVGSEAGEEHKQMLEQICRADKEAAPKVTKISEIKAMIELLIQDESVQCKPEIAEAIFQLDPVVNLESVCSEEAADKIVHFWSNYVDKKSEKRNALPRQLRDFFIGFGLQASRLCKTTLVTELEAATKAQGITGDDINVVTRSIRESGKMKKLFGDKPQLEDLMMIVKTDRQSATEERKKVSMPPKHKKYFELVQERCVNKFKPVYDSIVSPIVRLASIGLNYHDDLIDKILSSFSQSSSYQDWFNAIVACEPIVKFDAVLIPARKLNAEGDTALVTILEEDDIAELKEKTGLTLEEPAIVESVDYKVEVPVNDLLIDDSDGHLQEAISNYGKGFDETTKLRFRLLKRVPGLLNSMLEGKEIQFGLKPVDAEEAGKVAKFGMSTQSKLALATLAVGFALIAVVGATAAVLATFVAPIWAVVGGIIIVILLMGTVMVSSSAPE